MRHAVFIRCYQRAAPVFEIEIQNHLFIPSEISVPANTKVKLVVYNRDATPEEFESYELNREKVIMGKRKATIFYRPAACRRIPVFWRVLSGNGTGKGDRRMRDLTCC